MDAVHQTVTVQIAIQERVRPPAGPAQWWDVPPIVNVPIIVPRGGGFSMTLPLKKGDNGLLVFCDTCFDNWWVNGQTNAPPAQNTPALPVCPSGSQRQNEIRRHYVHDCGLIPGMWSQKDLLTAYSTGSLQIRSDDGLTVIDVSAAGVVITGAAVSLLGGLNGVTATQNGIAINVSTVDPSNAGMATLNVDGLIAAITNASTCSQLSAALTTAETTITAAQVQLAAGIAAVAPLATVPHDLPSVITWATAMVSTYTAPYANLLAQQAATVTKLADAVSAAAARASTLGCS
jgi:hypothetical protein